MARVSKLYCAAWAFFYCAHFLTNRVRKHNNHASISSSGVQITVQVYPSRSATHMVFRRKNAFARCLQFHVNRKSLL